MPARSSTALRFIIRACVAAITTLWALSPVASGQEASAPVAGGSLTMLAASDVDYLDPAQTYYTFGEMVTLATNRPLYSFVPGDALHPVPDLAADQPQISADQRTVTVTLRPGVRYAPPVGREVTSADVKYAFERFFSANVGGQYPGYFMVIKGAPSRWTRGVRRISGITTPDPRTIVFRLKAPVGVSFAASLVMPITVPVPREYARRFDTRSPSTYNRHVAFTGPYMVKNAASGALTGYRAGKSIQLVRNPNWDRATDYRPAYLDSILIHTDAVNARRSAQQVSSGRGLLLDVVWPLDVLAHLRATAPNLVTTVPSGGFRYFSLNTEVKPFTNINVRRAVLAGFDRAAARRARGGADAGDVASHFLPPDLPGFAEAGGYDGFTDIDYFNKGNETGNRALAAKYFKKAGYASGRYEGHRRLLLVGANVDPGKAQMEVAARQLRKLGFRVRLRLVGQYDVYTDWCQIPAKHVAMCGAGWFKDFADPESMLEPIFKGSLIDRRGGNLNYSMLADRRVDAAMRAAATATGDDRLRQWAAIDKMLIRDAAGIPFLWDKTSLLHAPNVAGVPNPYTALWDLSFTSLTP